MQRVDAPEILDSDAYPCREAYATLEVIGRINRWFGGVSTTQAMVERIAEATGIQHFSMLEVAAGLGEVPKIVRQKLARRGITLDITLLDNVRSHLPGKNHAVVADALNLPFADDAFDLVSCCLFAHHLHPQQLQLFARQALRVCRRAVLINDLVRHPMHLALACAGFPLMCNWVAWVDGLTSVRRAYTPQEIQTVLGECVSAGTPKNLEIYRYYLFRMGIIIRKNCAP